MGKFARYRRVVDPIYQGPTAAHCWAAALEWWLKVTPNRSQISQDDLVQMYAKKADGSLDPVSEFPTVKSECGMDSENISGSRFTEEYIFNKLAMGHLYIGYETPGKPYGHVIVAYGIASGLLNFMDPARGMHTYRKVSSYSDARMTVAWPAGATPTAP